jgi:Flp pilus assembly protein TadG
MTQTVIVAPVLFMLIMFILQFALIAHAQNVAEAAAQEGATAARRFDASGADGHAKASAALAQLGPRMLADRRVRVSRTSTTATVTVTGQVISLVPGFSPTITVTSSGPVERYVAPRTDTP